MKRELLTATAIGTLAVGYTTSTRAQVFDWSGPYAGAFLGYGVLGSHSIAFQPLRAFPGDLSFPGNVPTFTPGLPVAALSTGPFSALPFGSFGAEGLTAGGTLGFNQQFDRIVVGIETDLAYFGTSNSASAFQQNVTVNGIRATTTSLSVGTDWLYTLRGRIGFAQDRLLIFGTGGLALGRTRLSGAFGINENNLAFTPGPIPAPGKGTTVSTSALGGAFGSSSGMRAGYVLGGGAEYAITDHLTIKLEGLYYDLGSARTVLNGSGSSRTTTTVVTGVTTTTSTSGAFSIQPLRSVIVSTARSRVSG